MKILGIFFDGIGFSLKQVLDLVLTKFGIEKKYGIRYKKDLVSEKSFGFGFNQILGLVTHCLNPLSDSFD